MNKQKVVVLIRWSCGEESAYHTDALPTDDGKQEAIDEAVFVLREFADDQEQDYGDPVSIAVVLDDEAYRQSLVGRWTFVVES